ncbi:hypothetical protein BD414DRAFT_446482 [Trametes punicea]|nr:hypothetical protein BD414DRAFT_446482 [Trametes punicea]
MLSDWDSSLTELSSDEDEYLPSARKKRQGQTEYKINNYLRPCRTTTYTAKCLYDQIVDNTIELDPDYQRDVVWTETKQIGLIDSLLRNFYIPPIIFAVKRHDDGTETRTCIDGKQRLTSIQLETNKKWWFRGSDGEKRNLLPKQLLQAFANKQIVCVEYEDLSDDQEREIFQRVQLGVALTIAERMQAIPGPWPTLIREVQSIVLGDEGFGEDLDWGHDRGRDFSCLASIIHLIDKHPVITFPTPARLEKWLSVATPVPTRTREAVLETFQIFITLVRDKKYNTAFSKPSRVSPIEFIMTGVLIHRFRKTHSLIQLSSAIWLMRADVRKKHVDIRSNSKVTKTLFEFIDKGLDDLDLGSDGKGDIPASVAMKAYRKEGSKANLQVAPPLTVEKRPRHQEISSSDSESEATPKKRPSLSGPTSSRSVTTTTTTSARSRAATNKKSTSTAANVASTSKPSDKAAPKTTTSRASKASAASKAAEQAPSPVTASKSPTIGKTPTGRLTTRTTRTAASAAVDFLALSQPSELLAIEESGDNSVSAASPATKEPALKHELECDEPMDEDCPDMTSAQTSTIPDRQVNADSGETTVLQHEHLQRSLGFHSGQKRATPNDVEDSGPLPGPPLVNMASPILQSAGSTAQSTPTVATPADHMQQSSLEHLLVQRGHFDLAVPGTLSVFPIEPSHSSPTPPVAGVAAVYISSPRCAPPPITTAVIPPPPPPPPIPTPSVHGSPTGAAASPGALRASSVGRPSGDYRASPSHAKAVINSAPDRDREWSGDHRHSRHSAWSRDGERDNGYGPRQDRGRSRDRDSRRDRDWSRDYERSRSYGRSRGHDHSQSRSHDWHRNRDRSRSHDRTRDCDWSEGQRRYAYRSPEKDMGRAWERDWDRGTDRIKDMEREYWARSRYHDQRSEGYPKYR